MTNKFTDLFFKYPFPKPGHTRSLFLIKDAVGQTSDNISPYIQLAWTFYFKNGTIEFKCCLEVLFRVSWQHYILKFVLFFTDRKNINSR